MFNKLIVSSFTKIKPYSFKFNISGAHLLFSSSTRGQLIALNTKPQFENKSIASNVKTNSSEQNYIQIHNDPDTFGDSFKHMTKHNSNDDVDEDDVTEEKFLQNPISNSQKLSTKQYADLIKDHLQNNRVKEAIDVLEIRMIQEDRVKPENYIFNLLIGGCARVGYSKKAFNLYNKMKQRNLKITGGTYTSLFNACSMSPWKQDGLNKANKLREIMHEKGYHPNESNYNAMIKAYGRCGDIQTAFKLVDEMKVKNLDIKTDTFNHLLQACASDKDLGFRHALLVWHKMHQRRQIPDLYSFNLMLKCVQDCEIGDLPTMQQLIEKLLNNSLSERKLLNDDTDNQSQLLLQQPNNNENVSIQVPIIDDSISTDEAPNLLAKQPKMGSLISLREIRKPEDRLLLLGGAHCFLREMAAAKVTPTIKTFTALLNVLPSTLSAEKNLISTIRQYNVKCDIDFFNNLIKKRSLRFEYDDAKSVLTMINKAGLQPDIVTYGVLALGCKTKLDAQNLLQEMYTKDFRMNIQILGAMLKQACFHNSFDYILEIMKIVKDERMKPNEQFLMHLDNFHNRCTHLIKKNSKQIDESFKLDFGNFQIKLKNWQNFMGFKNMKLDEAVKTVREHPWEQFQYSQPLCMEREKNVKLRQKKKKIRSIQVIDKEKNLSNTIDKKCNELS